MFQNKYNKAITFSFDDGISQDKRLIDILNKYNLKATFNLNSGIQTHASNWYHNKKFIYRLNIDELIKTYEGHEIASHSLTHPFLEKLDIETIYNEIYWDKKNLENLFKTDIVGFAYPYGTYNNDVIEVLKRVGIKYARTIKNTNQFELSHNLLELESTCHFLDSNIMDLAKQFIELKTDSPKIFFIWGHSFELDSYESWDKFEKLCQYISNKEDIFYGTNMDVLL